MAHEIGPFSTAVDMLAALDAKAISSVELVEMHLARIDKHDEALNSIPVRTADRALDTARAADQARAAGESRALLGLPMTLKESTQVAGLPQSAGIEAFKDYRPQADGAIARSVLGAGACLLGKTNIPEAVADWQADSPVYGRTNNPWDLERTPGGSTGGGSAALAAGLTPLEIGSDIGGSIRVPAAYCGVYGHRPSETAVPRTGSFPLADRLNPAVVMAVQGPLARSATDLELLFDVVAGPNDLETIGFRIDLPAARHERLRDFRVAIMPALSLAQPSSEMQAKVDELASLLSSAGAKVGEAMPAVDHDAYFRDYMTVLVAITSQAQPRASREESAAAMDRSDPQQDSVALGLTIDAAGYMMALNRRGAAQAVWQDFFREWDVLVSPAALDAAFTHRTGDQRTRSLDIDGREVPYTLNIVYPMWAIFTGQPATAFPAGLSAAGLPLGLQAIGPYLEDRTTLRFAQLLEREWHAFEPPPAFA
ncbi:MAG TPA: amidase [Acidimicrobiales bacterium]|nr:amidase [Acidimicrobiales bacterium]